MTATLAAKRVKFTIKDTELLLRLFMDAPMLGKDIDQGVSTLGKLKDLHNRLIAKFEEVI